MRDIQRLPLGRPSVQPHGYGAELVGAFVHKKCMPGLILQDSEQTGVPQLAAGELFSDGYCGGVAANVKTHG
jgi:hypothetical protein